MRFRLILAFLLSCLAPAFAQSDSLNVGLVTCYPGADIYQLEGHSAIHLYGTMGGSPVDLAINYGVFDFNSPNFVYRFVKGETDYSMAITPWSRFIASYIDEGRRVIEHPVLLDSIQKENLINLINENYLPQNRVYRYNYVKDNCATRPLRIIERAIGDSIILPAPQSCADDSTFRQVMRAHHSHSPWYQFGIDLALGSGIDQKISDREKSFAPTLLGEQLSGATVAGTPITLDPIVIYQGHEDIILPPTPWYATPIAAGWALFVIVAIISWIDIRRGIVSRWFDTILYTLYGIAGIVIAFLVFISLHEATSPNWLILWLNPLCLIVPIFIWLKKRNYVVLSYQIVNFALILCMCVAWPWTGQSGNAAFIPLIGCDLLRSITYIVNFKKPQRSDRYTPYSRSGRYYKKR